MRLLRRLRALIRRDRLARDIEEEMRAHVELETEALRARGMDAREARRVARATFGGWDAVREATRDVHGTRRLETVLAELRNGVRSLLRSPLFALAAMSVLGLGVGAATASWGIARAVLWAPLPYADASRLVSVYEADSALARRRPPSWPAVREWSAETRTFEGLAYVRGESLGVEGAEGSLLVLAAFPTAEFFDVLGVHPVLGRVFDAEEVRTGARVAVLTWHLWRDQYGGDAGVIGRTLRTDVGPATVIGVLPDGVRYPPWADLFLPQTALSASSLAAIERRDLHVDAMTIGRLASGSTVEAAAAELRTFNVRAAEIHPDTRGWTNADLRFVRDELIGNSSGRVFLLAGATLLLLLVSCVNVAGLLIARAAARGREWSVRAALGGSRRRLAAQMLAESLVLALGGSVIGIAIAWATLRIVVARAGAALPRLEEAGLDPTALGFALLLGVLTAVAFGLVPALRAGRAAPMAALRSARGGTRSDERLRASLVVAEIALACLLVVGATSLADALLAQTRADLGFRTEDLTMIRVNPPLPRYASPEAALALYSRLREEVAVEPSVRRVALVNHPPLSGSSMPTDIRTSRAQAPDERAMAFVRTVSANYFDVFGIPFASGRGFDESDVDARAPVVVVNESLARREWPGRSALGESITVQHAAQGRPEFGRPMTLTVVGVVEDTQGFGPGVPESPAVYLPYTLSVWTSIFVVADGPGDLRDVVRGAVQRVDPDIPVAGPGYQYRARPIGDYLATQFTAGRLNTALLGGFAAVALLLASVGLFGVIAYLVVQRTREFGVRVAVGAARTDIVRLVLMRSLRLAAYGIVIGFAAAFVLGRILGATQPDLAGVDPLAWGAAAGVFAAAALLASALPAMRAGRIAPARILLEDS